MIACECGECGSTYKVKDQNAGKRFQCKYCEAKVLVPGGAKSSRPSGGAPPKRRKKAARREEPEYDEYEDYSADEYDEYDDYGDDDYDDYEEPRPAPRRRSSSKKSGKKKGKGRSSQSGERFESGEIFDRYAGNPLVWIGVPFGMAAIAGLLSLISEGAGLVFIGFGAFVFGILSLCAGIHSLVLVFKEDPVCGLMMLFVPFYGLYYLITRWDEQRATFVTQMSCILAILGMCLAGATLGGK